MQAIVRQSPAPILALRIIHGLQVDDRLVWLVTIEVQDPLDCVMSAPVKMARVVSGLHGGNIQVGLIIVLVRKRRCRLVPGRARVLGDQVDGRGLASGTAYFVGQRHELTVETRREDNEVANSRATMFRANRQALSVSG